MAVANKSAKETKTSGAVGSRTGKNTADRKTANRSGGNTAGRSKKNQQNGKAAEGRKKSLEKINEYQDYRAFETGITIFVILLLSVFLYLSYLGLAGNTGIVAGGLFFGIFGWFAWFLPLFCLIGFVFCMVNRGDRRVPRRIVSFGGIVLVLMGLSDLLFQKQIISEYYISNHVMHKNFFECMFLSCRNVMKQGKFNGGLIGRAVGGFFSSALGRVGASIILFLLLLLCLYIFYGIEMMGMLRKRNAYRQEMNEMYQEVSQDEEYREPSYRVFNGYGGSRSASARRRNFMPREMQKVPKVQTFDLKKINGLDRPMEKETEVFPVKEEIPEKAEKKASGKKLVQAVPVAEKEEPEVAVQVEAAVQEAIVTEETVTPLIKEEIPIYRNELNEKFGKKKKTAWEKADKQVQVLEYPLEKVRESENLVQEPLLEEENLVQEKSLEEENLLAEHLTEEVSLFEETQEEELTEKPIEIKESEVTFDAFAAPEEKEEEQEENLLESEVFAEAMQRAEEKPMASFAPKEEVTDVTPSSQKPEAGRQKGQPVTNVRNVETPKKQAASHGKIGGDNYVSASDTFNALNESKVAAEDIPYEFPEVSLLSLPKETEGSVTDEELRMTASKLQDTLKSFNVNVRMGAVTCGPTVTRYELLPEQGVRVNKITNLADDLKLSLAAASIRIEAPIPGKAAVGIEVPNPVPSSVYFRELLEGDAFTDAKSPLTFAVGKDIAGKLIMADIAKMPHLLIAGATGSGKSVCINTLIMSILYKADPKDVKLIMIDPKVVELSVYNGIPHLFCPVVTDPKEAAAALNWAVREMMDRYNKFQELGVRNIAGYNEKIKKVENAEASGYGKMPYLVVIVDEFADLMMVASKEVEDAVCRLAQLARAAGIHLVLATQRPSVNVITGVIKANIPSRIAFSVSSVIDSRTILDKGGAEKLLGKGDMLFFPSGYSEPVRVQGAFVSDKEVSDVVEFLCSNNEVPEYDHSVTQIVEEPKEEAAAEKKPQDDRDEYFEEAGRFVIESDRAAAGQLQRKFSIGFNRAGRIIDQLNKAGVVGPAEGTKPRKVLMTIEEFEQMLSGGAVVSDNAIENMVREMEDEFVSTEERLEEMF